MVTDVTVNVPRPDMSLALDELEGLDALGDDADGDEDDALDDAPDAPLPENRPMTVT